MESRTTIGALTKGTTLQNGKYTIEGVLGQGATGITYLASMHQKLSGNLSAFEEKVHVAIKEFYFKDECQRESTTLNVMIANINNEAKVAQFKNSFIKEAKRIAGLSHPNIVHVLGIFEENATVYYVMQYIRGGSVKEKIDREGPIAPEKVVKYGMQIASALNYMHSKKMCHYDMKPGNIMLSSDDNAQLIDFGIAKNYDSNGQETSTTPPGLTKGFAPLEQYSSVTEFSPLIDVYSLGATIYAMLTGKTPPEPMKWIEKGFPERPENIPSSLWNIVKMSMSTIAANRPTMQGMYEMLSQVNIVTNHDADADKTIYAEDLYNKQDIPHPELLVETYENPKEVSQKDNVTEGTNIRDNKLKKIWFYIALMLVGIITGALVFWLLTASKSFSTPSGEEVSTDTLSTIYNIDGQAIMTFTGELINGQPSGRGTLTYLKDKIKDRYEGNFVDGLRQDSVAALFYKNGDVYRGAFEKDHFSIGRYYVNSNGEIFQGKFKNDTPWNGVWYDSKNNVISRVEDGQEK